MRRISFQTLAITVGIALLVWFVGGIILAGREPAPPPPQTQPLTLRGGRVTGNRISTRSWTFDYTHAQLSPDGSIATVDGVRHGILYRKGKPYLSISAEHVSVNTQTFDFSATGLVHVEEYANQQAAKRSFDTDLVQWVNATKMLTLAHPSLLRTGDQTLKVASITVNFNTNDVHLGKIEGTVEAPEH